ncbi:GNAT family N-acetyltransferase [Streptomyces mirabilis]|uniref:GNAT family N-acetyltransferase n=1 Tax=Streptomyces mirabilis TaxID=68239 RepID=UPI00339ED9B4
MSDAQTPSVQIVDNTAANRYEARIGSVVAGFAEYIRTERLIAFVHTEVNPGYEGQGIGAALVRSSLDEARSAGLAVLPVCPFYAGWIARHPDYQALLYSGKSKVSD